MERVGAKCRLLLAVAAWLLLLAGLGPPILHHVPPVAAQAAPIRVPILAYHAVDASASTYSVTAEQLDEQCRWLVENGYTAITLGQFWAAVTEGAVLPPNPVLLTNDDGWSSTVLFAEILARYGMVGTYFVNNTSPLPPDQIAALSLRGGVHAHTASHANLTGLAYEGQLAEIAGNKTHIEQITGQPVTFLAWPFGETNEGAVQAAAAAGIVGAFGLGGTAAQVGALDPYRIPRIIVGSSDDLASFATKVAWH